MPSQSRRQRNPTASTLTPAATPVPDGWQSHSGSAHNARKSLSFRGPTPRVDSGIQNNQIVAQRKQQKSEAREALAFALKWMPWDGGADEDIFVHFSLTPLHYFLRIKKLLSTPAAANLSPVEKAELRRICSARLHRDRSHIPASKEERIMSEQPKRDAPARRPERSTLRAIEFPRSQTQSLVS
ncbi:MAG: DUF3263 domain-containing protein [Comamonadaceae bacterium]|nr:MAG: DUF3263 domain-containing protein [Comamonadaceae bacterium]